jgi:hypothetical protein
MKEKQRARPKERIDTFASESFVFICCRRREMSLAMLASASRPFLPFVSASSTHQKQQRASMRLPCKWQPIGKVLATEIR